jgi:hypothetical protein
VDESLPRVVTRALTSWGVARAGGPLDHTAGTRYHRIMVRDRAALRAALRSPRSEAARDAALELGAVGTLFDVPLLETARAAAQIYYEELVAALSQRVRGAEPAERHCGTAYVESAYEAQHRSVIPFEQGLALLQARLHPDGGVAALVSRGCTRSLLSSHIRWRDDLDLFTRLLVVMTRDQGRASTVAFRELSALTECSHPIWTQRAALAIGGWCSRERLAELCEIFDAECEVARIYGWKLDEQHHTALLRISVAFGCARFGGWEERFLAPALSAISSAAYPPMARLLESRLVEAPPSSGRDQLRAALQHAASR